MDRRCSNWILLMTLRRQKKNCCSNGSTRHPKNVFYFYSWRKISQENVTITRKLSRLSNNSHPWKKHRSFRGFFLRAVMDVDLNVKSFHWETSKLKIRSLFGNFVCRLCAWHWSKICNYTPVLGSFIFSRRHAYVDNATVVIFFL